MIRLGVLVLVAASLLWVGTTAVARNTMSRREIRSMPILERPSRPGHFYGNAVRRNHQRVVESGPAPDRGAWEGYSPAPVYDAWGGEQQMLRYDE